MRIRPINIIALCAILSASCNPYKIEIPDWGDYEHLENNDEVSEVEYPVPGVEKVKTVLTNSWAETKIADGVTHYYFSGNDDISGQKQNVNVLEVDLNNDSHYISFVHVSPADSTSAVAQKNGAIAAINATYEMPAVYVRLNGYNQSTVTLSPDIQSEWERYWKHNAAIVSDGRRKIGIVNGARGMESTDEGGDAAIDLYNRLPEKWILASAPMLIDDYDPVGERFVPSSLTSSDLNKLNYEDYRRHQGVRHPRTAVALTADNDLLLIVVDGRAGKSAGMSAKELTLFIQKHFNPQWALNMDGGGSSTMYIKGYGDPVNDVLNYPTDNDTWDHYGQRTVRTHICVCPVNK